MVEINSPKDSLEADELDGQTLVRECVCEAMNNDHTQEIQKTDLLAEVSEWIDTEGFGEDSTVWTRVMREALDYMASDEFSEHVDEEFVRARNHAEARKPPVGSDIEREREIVAQNHVERERTLRQ
jgi:hypothetical protein